MTRLINLLFATAIILAFGLAIFGLSGAHADQHKAMQELRETSVMVNGVRCTGSGSIVQGRSGHQAVLTNNHVCNCASENGYFYATRDDGEVIKARIVKRSWAYDLCAGAIENSRQALKLAPGLMPLSEVYSRGYPGGRMVETHGTVRGDERWSFDMPIDEVGTCPSGAEVLRGLNGNVAGCSLSFTSTMTNLYGRPGSSGSPVVNEEGQLVGVVSSWMPGQEYSAGMVPFSAVESFLGQL